MLSHPDYEHQTPSGGAQSKSDGDNEPNLLGGENNKTRRASCELTDTGPSHKKSTDLNSFAGDNGGTLHDGEASFATTGTIDTFPGEEGMLWQLSLRNVRDEANFVPLFSYQQNLAITVDQ
jgi:hypothetical protein